MIDIIIDSIMSVRHTINTNNVTPCFELFGYDFMIDEDFRVWLIEVNTNPYLGLSNSHMKKSNYIIKFFLRCLRICFLLH